MNGVQDYRGQSTICEPKTGGVDGFRGRKGRKIDCGEAQ